MSDLQLQDYGRFALAELPEHMKRDVTLSYFDKVILGIVMSGDCRLSDELSNVCPGTDVSIAWKTVDSGRLFSVVQSLLGLSEELFEHVVSELVMKGYLELEAAPEAVSALVYCKGRRLRSVEAMCRDLIGGESFCGSS